MFVQDARRDARTLWKPNASSQYVDGGIKREEMGKKRKGKKGV